MKKTKDEVLIAALTKNYTSIQEQLDFVLNETVNLTGSRYGYIYLYDENQEVFTINSWSESVLEDCDLSNTTRHNPLCKIGLWGDVVRKAKPIVINDYNILAQSKSRSFPGHLELKRFMSVPIIIENVIVAAVGFANKSTDYTPEDVNTVTIVMNGVWHNIERKKRELELITVVQKLKANESRLQLILDSTADAIFGVDLEGICTFCNSSSLRLLGLKNESDFVGKKCKDVFKCKSLDDDSHDYCIIEKTYKEGIKIVSKEGEMFFRPDGSTFYVEYSSYPQFNDDAVVGAVVSFSDISERVIREKELLRSSYLDILTGIYNRRFFEMESVKLDIKENYPLSIIIGDVNGLKIVNDIFGHQAGDQLLQNTAKILNEYRRPKDILARWGGDEFVMLLPNTTYEEASSLSAELKKRITAEKINGLSCTISWGCATKTEERSSLKALINKADELMYIEKTLNSRSFNYSTIINIINILFERSPNIKAHSERVRDISERFGRRLGLSKSENQRLVEASYFHDIGKIVFPVDPEEFDFKKHPVVGFRILNNSEDTTQLAKYVLSHHEYWDGTGTPKGLKGEEIPRISRIISIVEYFDAVTAVYSSGLTKEAALDYLAEKSGTIFDPYIAEEFIAMMKDDI